MGEYKVFINKKRKELPKKSFGEHIADYLSACQRLKLDYSSVTDKQERAKIISQVKKHEAMAKVKGYEACRQDVDIPIMHKMIREIEQIRVVLTQNPV